jgi:protein-S-isoprenylcysteine O-methyltransferase
MSMPQDLGFKTLAVYLSLVWALLEMAYAVCNRRASGSASHEKDKGSFIWITVSITVGMTVACTFAFSGKGAFRHAHRWELAGLLLLIVGAVIRLHAIRILGRHFTSRVTILQDHALVRDGLYRFVRHPSYLGEILILIGLGAVLANAVSLVAAPLFATVVLLLRIQLEERALAEHFGQAYEDYRRVTWRLLPPIW